MASVLPATEAGVRPGSRRIPATLCIAGATLARQESVVEETPVGLVYDGRIFAVMLATPTDLEDFAVGFSLTEGIAGPGEVTVLAVEEEGDGYSVHMSLPEERLARLIRRRRALVGGSGCGRCGAESFTETLRPLPPVRSPLRVAPAAIRAAMAALPAWQSLNHEVGAVHAAGFATPDGTLVAAREDVGRHNALDKLVGALLRAGIDPADGFVVMSSRCSFELVHKTAAAGIPLIAAVSAPTGLALEFAGTAGVGVAAFVRDGRFTVYAVPDRFALEADAPTAGRPH